MGEDWACRRQPVNGRIDSFSRKRVVRGMQLDRTSCEKDIEGTKSKKHKAIGQRGK